MPQHCRVSCLSRHPISLRGISAELPLIARNVYLDDVCLRGGPASRAIRAGAVVRRHLALPAGRQPLLHVGQQRRQDG